MSIRTEYLLVLYALKIFTVIKLFKENISANNCEKKTKNYLSTKRSTN